MTRKEKELLAKDLSGRLDYEPYIKIEGCANGCSNVFLTGIYYDYEDYGAKNYYVNNGYDISRVKPYLFPLSSMTEKLIHEFYCMFIENDISFEDFVADYWNTNSFHKLLTSIDDCVGVVEWFNENHCDYRGLIEKGLAIDATNLNIYYQ